MSITITLSHEIEALEALKNEWIELQTRSSATGMAVTWQWHYIYYKHFNKLGELWLLEARNNQKLVGIAPLIKVKQQPDRFFAWQQLEFIGTAHNGEHLDFIIELGYEEQVIPLFIDKLYEHRPRWDVIRLTGLCETNTPDILQRTNRDWFEHTRKNKISPYITLPDTMDEWMLSVSRNHRKKLRRYRKKLDEQFPDQWSITQVTQSDELEETFNSLEQLHRAHWEGAMGEWGSFHKGELTEYYRDLVQILLHNNWLRMYRLDIDNQPSAVNFCYHYRERAYNAIAGVDREVTTIALGHILTHHSIDQAIYEGLPEMTFMWGEMPWKYSFGAVNRVHHVYELIGSPRVRLQVKIVAMLRKVKSQLLNIKSQIRKVTTDEVESRKVLLIGTTILTHASESDFMHFLSISIPLT